MPAAIRTLCNHITWLCCAYVSLECVNSNESPSPGHVTTQQGFTAQQAGPHSLSAPGPHILRTGNPPSRAQLPTSFPALGAVVPGHRITSRPPPPTHAHAHTRRPSPCGMAAPRRQLYHCGFVGDSAAGAGDLVLLQPQPVSGFPPELQVPAGLPWRVIRRFMHVSEFLQFPCRLCTSS